eukprot:CAMPEP_0115850182 /NCGR_PEP_ID=MMETSP0287-20121206/11831_1 /TAXON_ID=412157 /ORGANISM="Chrysochromulina rotalis, Strain UIO044" /LENGTH=64 /DNA_ID=CAMNT_0003304169 /DNA_START=243 /DNA_END=437 /DNA_ORIENTATION=-
MPSHYVGVPGHYVGASADVDAEAHADKQRRALHSLLLPLRHHPVDHEHAAVEISASAVGNAVCL